MYIYYICDNTLLIIALCNFMSFKEAENSIYLQILLYMFSNLPFLVLFIQDSLESLWIQVKNLTYLFFLIIFFIVVDFVIH